MWPISIKKKKKEFQSLAFWNPFSTAKIRQKQLFPSQPIVFFVCCCCFFKQFPLSLEIFIRKQTTIRKKHFRYLDMCRGQNPRPAGASSTFLSIFFRWREKQYFLASDIGMMPFSVSAVGKITPQCNWLPLGLLTPALVCGLPSRKQRLVLEVGSWGHNLTSAGNELYQTEQQRNMWVCERNYPFPNFSL